MARYAKQKGQKSMRFEFEVTLNFVEVHIPIEADLMVVWKRGAKRVETREKVTISPDNPRGDFSETIRMLATLSKDPKKNKYLEKNSTLTVKLVTPNKMKSAGMVKLDLAKYAESEPVTEELGLKKCPDRYAKIGFTVKNTLIQADCMDADTLSQMTDLRSLDSAPDSQFDFEDLKKNREEEDAYEKMDPMKMLNKNYENEKKGLPPAFGSSKFKNLSSEQFSLRGKAATSTMDSLRGGPIKASQVRAKDVSETPDKMEDCDVTTDEEGNPKKSPSGSRFKEMPDTSQLSDPSPQSQKQSKVFKRGSIKLSKSKRKKSGEGSSHNKYAFDYNEDKPAHEFEAPTQSKERNREPSYKDRNISEEVKDLRAKIRSLEDEKRRLKEESIKVKQDCSEEIRKAMQMASGSDDKQVELLQQTVSELEMKKDKLELGLSKKDNEIDKLKRKIEDKEIDIKHMKEKRKEQEAKISEAENKVRQVQVEMKEYREKIGNYELENSGLKKEIQTMNTNFGRLKDENSELNNMVELLRAQMENKRASFKESSGVDESEFDDYKTATEALITDLKAQIKDLEKKNEDLSDDYERVLNEKEQYEADQHSKLQKANKEIAYLQQSEGTLKSTIDSLEKRVEEMMQERLEKERDRMDNQGELNGKYRALEVKYSQAQEKLDDREKKLKSLESKLGQIEEEKLYMISHEEQKRDELLMEYRGEMNELKDKISELENKNDELLIEKDMLQQQLDREQNSNFQSNDIMEGNERLLSQIKKLQTQVMEKDNQILDLQTEVEDASSSKTKNRKGHKSRRDNATDNRELAEMSVENEFLRKQVEELQERLNDVQNIGRSSDTSSADMQYDNSNLHNQLSRELIDIKTKYAESEQERNALQLKLRERNDTLKKFSAEITKYEFEMVKAKQSLGEALNQNIELDMYNGELLETIEKLKTKDKKKKK